MQQQTLFSDTRLTRTEAVELTEVKAITLYRPWGYAIAHLGKDVENRSWRCPLPVGEWIAIHSGQKSDSHAIAMITEITGQTIPSNLEQGAIVAVTQFMGNTSDSDSPWFVGPIGWQLANTIAIEPVPCKGSQGLWNLPSDVLGIVRSRYQAATRVSALLVGQKVYVPAQARYGVVVRKGLRAEFRSPKKGLIIVDQVLVKLDNGKEQRIEPDCLEVVTTSLLLDI